MAEFIKVGDEADFPPGSVHRVLVNGEERTLYSVDPSTAGVNTDCPYYASQLHCWHRHPDTHPSTHCELSETGVLSGHIVKCEIQYKSGCAHGSQYDVFTGEKLSGPGVNRLLVQYEAKCENGEVFVWDEPIAPAPDDSCKK